MASDRSSHGTLRYLSPTTDVSSTWNSITCNDQLTDELPGAIRLAAGRPVRVLGLASDHRGRGVFPAIASIVPLEGLLRRDLILTALLGIVPDDGLAVPTQF